MSGAAAVYSKRGADLRVADVVREVAAARPDHLAIRCGERELSYRELDERSNRLAQALLAAGADAGSRIAYLDRTGPEVIELLFAASKIGAVTVPLNWRLSRPELASVVADAQPPVLIAGETYAAVAEELAEGRRLVVVEREYENWLAEHDAVDPGGGGESEDVVLQMYTSGTTGTPKGVLTTNRNMAACAETSPWWSFDSDSVSMTPLPMFHIGGIGWAFLGLWNGATTVLAREFEAAAALDIIEGQHVTNVVLVPTMLQLLIAVPGASERDFSALRCITYGASPITTPVLSAALRTFRAPLFGIYGLTETTGGITQLEPADHDLDGPRQHLLQSAGRPFPWVELRIADPQTGAELGSREVGEVWLRAPNVMAGYYNHPEETAAAVTEDGWLRTGDGGYLDDEGYLFLTDRIKDMIVSGGENVYPIEVEEVVAQHPDVAEVAVIGVPDPRWGETVMALVVRHTGAKCTEEELVEFARARLAGYKLPRSVEFVEKLPRTPTGKVLKRELRERYGAKALDLVLYSHPG